MSFTNNKEPFLIQKDMNYIEEPFDCGNGMMTQCRLPQENKANKVRLR